MKHKILAVLLAVCCIAPLFTGCSQLETLLNLLPDGNAASADTTVTARVIREAPCYTEASADSEIVAHVSENTEVIPDGIDIVGDSVWISCVAPGLTGWIELEYLWFDYTDQAGTLPVQSVGRSTQIYFHPTEIKQQTIDDTEWIEVSNICLYAGSYWGYVDNVGYILMNDVSLPANFHLPMQSDTDTAIVPIDLTGTWYREVFYYADALGAEETWTFRKDGTFLIYTEVYYDTITKPGITMYSGGKWQQNGEILWLTFMETTSDGVILDNPSGEEGYSLVIQGQDGPVICGGDRTALSPSKTYGEDGNAVVDKPSEPESSKLTESSKPAESSKPQSSTDGISYKPLEGLLGTWHTFHGDYCRVWKFTKGDGSFKVDGQIPFYAEYTEGKLDKDGNLIDIREHKIFDYGYFKAKGAEPLLEVGMMYLVCGPDVYGPYEVRLEHGDMYIDADGWQPGYDYLVHHDSGNPPKPEQEESKPAEVKHALTSRAFDTPWFFENASGDGEDVVRETWNFTERTNIVTNGYYDIHAAYKAEILNADGESVQLLYYGSFEFLGYEDGLYYFADGETPLDPFTIEVHNNSILIKAFQYNGGMTERYFICE